MQRDVSLSLDSGKIDVTIDVTGNIKAILGDEFINWLDHLADFASEFIERYFEHVVRWARPGSNKSFERDSRTENAGSTAKTTLKLELKTGRNQTAGYDVVDTLLRVINGHAMLHLADTSFDKTLTTAYVEVSVIDLGRLN